MSLDPYPDRVTECLRESTLVRRVVLVRAGRRFPAVFPAQVRPGVRRDQEFRAARAEPPRERSGVGRKGRRPAFPPVRLAGRWARVDRVGQSGSRVDKAVALHRPKCHKASRVDDARGRGLRFWNPLQSRMAAFDYTLDFKTVNFREQPELYRIGKGEQGVLLVEPYKSEILPYWRFKTPEVAEVSSSKIYELFEAYLAAEDFPGADMARKFLQMGWTRARRYANHRGGKKYDGPVPDDQKGRSGAHGRALLSRELDPVKAAAAAVFYARYVAAREHPEYLKQRARHLSAYENDR